MEECKSGAKNAGLAFFDETLEYIVTNRDLLHLFPKMMIPTLYDYWVHDVEVLKEYGKYKLYPTNPYETSINSRPAISFYNDNNPDWLNIMIFYHVIAHIDMFQNNIFFQHTWNDDFVGIALADKRLIESLRLKHGRWVDYVIEFSRSIDNITGYHKFLAALSYPADMEADEKVQYYFNTFLQEIIKASLSEIHKEKEKYNSYVEKNENIGYSMFFSDIRNKYPEFQSYFEKAKGITPAYDDILEFIRDNSPFLKKEANQWMQQIMTIIRNTALYFAPQIRTKILNEGWASYWHDHLFISDERIAGHEADYAKINAGITSLNRIGLNPYAIGLRLISYVEELANKGKMDYFYQKIINAELREKFNKNTGKGKNAIFELRKNFSDFMLINTFIDQDFLAQHNLFVTGKRYNYDRNVIEYYIKSRKAKDYKEMLLDQLYHPPLIKVNKENTNENNLYLIHCFEKKQLIKEFIPDVLVGLEFLWGDQVEFETTELLRVKDISKPGNIKLEEQKVIYTCKDKKVTKKKI